MMLRCEGCVQCWEVSSLHPLAPTEARGTCVKRVGILVDHFQPMYLWPGNTNLTQVGTYARVYTQRRVSATFPAPLGTKASGPGQNQTNPGDPATWHWSLTLFLPASTEVQPQPAQRA